MQRKPEYTIGTDVVKVTVNFPDSLKEFGDEARVIELFSAWVCHHHVQSAVKGAMEKRATGKVALTPVQVKLLADVAAGNPINGLEFIPDKRKAVARKDNAVVTQIRAKWAGWDVAKKKELVGKWKIPGKVEELTMDGLIAGYWAYNDAALAAEI